MRKKLSEPEIADALLRLANWTRTGNEIARTFTFQNFRESIDFVNRVTELAEAADHHPDVDIRWSKVTLRLSTHSAGALTTADFDLAAKIDAAESDGPGCSA